jgi:hypothetical protein
MGRSLWREDAPVVNNCSWPLPVQTFSGPTPVGLVTIIYCLRFETSLFVASYDSQGYGGGIRPRLHTGDWTDLSTVNFYLNFFLYPFAHRKHRFQQVLYCCLRILCRGNFFTEPLTFPLASLFQSSGVMSQYCHLSGAPWRIMSGFGLDDWINWHCCYNYT